MGTAYKGRRPCLKCLSPKVWGHSRQAAFFRCCRYSLPRRRGAGKKCRRMNGGTCTSLFFCPPAWNMLKRNMISRQVRKRAGPAPQKADHTIKRTVCSSIHILLAASVGEPCYWFLSRDFKNCLRRLFRQIPRITLEQPGPF